MTIKLGRYEVPEDWPVQGEAGRTFREKLKNGFFSTYMVGDVVIDVGYRGGHDDAVPILPHAIGVDLDFPGYDGTKLPFADESVDTVYSSHVLEHVSDYREMIRDWHRVLRAGGFIIFWFPTNFSTKRSATGRPSGTLITSASIPRRRCCANSRRLCSQTPTGFGIFAIMTKITPITLDPRHMRKVDMKSNSWSRR